MGSLLLAQLEGCPLSEGVMYRLRWSWDLSLLERCPHFRGCYVQASMELGPEDVSLLERCPHFKGLCTGFNGVGT